MVAHKLLAVEVDWRRERETLLREIKRLRSEVGLMTRRCNNSRKETQDMVTRLRIQPPPPVPRRPVDMREQVEVEGVYVEMKSMGGGVEEKQEEQEKEESVPVPEPTPESEPEPEPTPESEPEPEHHHSPPKHSPSVRSPTHTSSAPAPENQEERYQLSKERMIEFGAVIANGSGGAAVDACAERWMLVWMKFCIHLAEGGMNGEAIYGGYKGEEKWDDQVIKWWNDLRNEMRYDENDMSGLMKMTEVDKVDRMCWKMKFVKGFNVNLEGNDMVLRVGGL